eukprot:TRINITY_DN47545_c1_g1_i1.p1 TRINITY_DN47545_c1_g1~~TRINITY_DN47545_c1_g1_i1.p1  ORF type:complete len:112 (+),score=17.19 TRINITY_DN47545_c1_g1_i1:173-508(+)
MVSPRTELTTIGQSIYVGTAETFVLKSTEREHLQRHSCEEETKLNRRKHLQNHSGEYGAPDFFSLQEETAINQKKAACSHSGNLSVEACIRPLTLVFSATSEPLACVLCNK